MKCVTCSCPLPPSGSLCPCGKAAYCTTECQKKNWKEHKQHCPPFKVAKLPGRGRGLLATRKLGVGEVLLSELPLMVIDSEDSEVTSAVFEGEFSGLEAVAREAVLRLFDPVRDDLKRELLENISEVEAEMVKGAETGGEELGELATRMGELGKGIAREVEKDEQEEQDHVRAQRIFAANSMQVCEVASLYSPTEGALYNQISLLNHSCNPNSVWSWTKDDFRRKTVRVMKPIQKGEEIVVNYVDLEEFNYGSREARRAVLAERFGFFCQCSECSLEGAEFDLNEERRRTVVESLATVKSLMAQFKETATVAALKTGGQAVKTVFELGLLLEMPRLLLNMYQVATAARYQNILGSANPTVFSSKALTMCGQFGDSFTHFYNFVCRPD